MPKSGERSTHRPFGRWDWNRERSERNAAHWPFECSEGILVLRVRSEFSRGFLRSNVAGRPVGFLLHSVVVCQFQSQCRSAHLTQIQETRRLWAQCCSWCGRLSGRGAQGRTKQAHAPKHIYGLQPLPLPFHTLFTYFLFPFTYPPCESLAKPTRTK